MHAKRLTIGDAYLQRHLAANRTLSGVLVQCGIGPGKFGLSAIQFAAEFLAAPASLPRVLSNIGPRLQGVMVMRAKLIVFDAKRSRQERSVWFVIHLDPRWNVRNNILARQKCQNIRSK
jgi:hypothetical protein